MKIPNLFTFLWVIFALLDPDLESESVLGSGSTDLIESGSNTDPDLKHCFVQCVPEVQPDERDAEAAGSARHPRLLPVQGRRQVRQRRPRRTGQSVERHRIALLQ
jgi:hypothetical protein